MNCTNILQCNSCFDYTYKDNEFKDKNLPINQIYTYNQGCALELELELEFEELGHFCRTRT